MKRIVETIVMAGLLVAFTSSCWAEQKRGEGQAAKTAPKKERAAEDAAKATGFTLPAGVRSDDVQFDGAGLRLAGTMLLPPVSPGERVPGVLVIGATPSAVRDGFVLNGATHHTSRDIAAYLAGRGYAVLRYDTRCAGASACQPRSPLASYADDARHAVEYLRSRPEVDPKRVVILGHGDGGFLASIAASETAPAGLVLVATSGRSGDKLMRERAARYLAERGTPEAERSAYLKRLEEMMVRFKAGNVDLGQEKIDPRDEFLTHFVKYSDFAYSWLQDDPLQAMAVLSLPVLIVQGEKDTQMASKDAHYLEEALKRADNSDVTLRLLPNADHALKINEGAVSLKAEADAARPLDAEFLKTLGEWLDKKLKK